MDKNKKVEYIRGKVVNEQGKPIPYANVLVLQAGDSTFVNGCVTEDDGTFLLPDPYADHYLLWVTYVGYQSQTVTCMAENYLQMRPQENQLKEVTVTATRPLVERKNGAYLTHITGTPLSLMGSAADMIGHLPFVTGSDGNYWSLDEVRPRFISTDERFVTTPSYRVYRPMKSFRQKSLPLPAPGMRRMSRRYPNPHHPSTRTRTQRQLLCGLQPRPCRKRKRRHHFELPDRRTGHLCQDLLSGI